MVIMKEYLHSLVAAVPNPLTGTQPGTRVPAGIDPAKSAALGGMMFTLAFLGGTALRFLYNSLRYSEDLDFSSGGDPRRMISASISMTSDATWKPRGMRCTLNQRLKKRTTMLSSASRAAVRIGLSP